jgi:NitT/TauT family transport system substrate-binding protein
VQSVTSDLEELMSIRLQESLRAVFYAPFYVALAQGAYEAEGVDITFVVAPAPGEAAKALVRGDVDVCWGGPMRVMQEYDADQTSDLVCFCEVVTRDPFFLIGRVPAPGFGVADLVGKRVGSVSEVPTPWMCLQQDLRDAGVDPASIDRVADRGMGENAAALLRGELDVVQVFQPFAEDLLHAGGHLWYAQADRGPTSYTCFYARAGTLAARRPELLAMTRAVYRAQRFVAGATGAEIAGVIAQYFPEIAVDRLGEICGRYNTLGVWGRDPVLPRAGYDRLRDSLLSGGFVTVGKNFEAAVDNSLAKEVLAAGK